LEQNILGVEKSLQSLLNNINPSSKNPPARIYLNIIHNEFYRFNGTFIIPAIPVKGLDPDQSYSITSSLIKYIPEFLKDHIWLEKSRPLTEVHSLQYVKRINGRLCSFIHMLSLDLKFSGDTSSVIEKGNSDLYPSYTSDRIYYKSRLVPELKSAEGADPAGFQPLRIFDKTSIESDGFFHSFAMFEELNTGEISRNLCNAVESDVFNVSLNLYPFIAYDFFTACLNIIDPVPDELEKGVELFEPLFLFLYSKFKKIDDQFSGEIINELFSDELRIKNSEIHIRDEFFDKLRAYFSRFSLLRDDDLALKGWWEFNIEK